MAGRQVVVDLTSFSLAQFVMLCMIVNNESNMIGMKVVVAYYPGICLE
jgi:hypothetical protein